MRILIFLLLASRLSSGSVIPYHGVTIGITPYSAPVNSHSQYHAQDKYGQYVYGYASGLSAKDEIKTADGITRGGYSYIDANGILQTVQYISDPVNGFRVVATNIPRDLPEVALAKAQHYQAYENIKAEHAYISGLQSPVVISPQPVGHNWVAPVSAVHTHVASAPVAPVAYVPHTVHHIPIPISSQYHSQDNHGQYTYGYAGPLSSKSEIKTADGVTRGGYSYIDANGVLQNVQYVADPVHGFRVQATNLPEAPAVTLIGPKVTTSVVGPKDNPAVHVGGTDLVVPPAVSQADYNPGYQPPSLINPIVVPDSHATPNEPIYTNPPALSGDNPVFPQTDGNNPVLTQYGVNNPGLGNLEVIPQNNPGLGNLQVIPQNNPGLGNAPVLSHTPGLVNPQVYSHGDVNGPRLGNSPVLSHSGVDGSGLVNPSVFSHGDVNGPRLGNPPVLSHSSVEGSGLVNPQVYSHGDVNGQRLGNPPVFSHVEVNNPELGNSPVFSGVNGPNSGNPPVYSYANGPSNSPVYSYAEGSSNSPVFSTGNNPEGSQVYSQGVVNDKHVLPNPPVHTVPFHSNGRVLTQGNYLSGPVGGIDNVPVEHQGQVLDSVILQQGYGGSDPGLSPVRPQVFTDPQSISQNPTYALNRNNLLNAPNYQIPINPEAVVNSDVTISKDLINGVPINHGPGLYQGEGRGAFLEENAYGSIPDGSPAGGALFVPRQHHVQQVQQTPVSVVQPEQQALFNKEQASSPITVQQATANGPDIQGPTGYYTQQTQY